jgi:hypothetical protein
MSWHLNLIFPLDPGAIDNYRLLFARLDPLIGFLFVLQYIAKHYKKFSLPDRLLSYLPPSGHSLGP